VNGDPAVGDLEPQFFNNLVLVLDHLFVHRLRKLEGKDGNPANEVRVLSASLMENGGILAADSQITLDPGSSVLGYAVGDTIAIEEEGFTRLAEVYFDEIESRYV
jgi:hypothetical protein